MLHHPVGLSSPLYLAKRAIIANCTAWAASEASDLTFRLFSVFVPLLPYFAL